MKSSPKKKEAERIKRISREYFGITEAQQCSKNRHRGLVMSRHIAMFFIRQRTHLSLSATGELFNITDHTTVLNSLNTLVRLLSVQDPRTVLAFNEISKKVNISHER